MSAVRQIALDGRTITVRTPGGEIDRETFGIAEAAARAAVMREAMSWVGTPFRNCGDVKGPRGAVDCAMSLVRWHVDTGRLPPFDPRPYPPNWHLHRSEERFLGWVRDRLGGVEVLKPRMGDVVVFQFGRCFSHGGLYVGNGEIVHAYFGAGFCITSRLCETELSFLPNGKPRPVKYFEIPEHS